MMTADEFALLKELVRWRRNHGGEYIHACASLRLADGRTIAWETVGALHWPRSGEVGVNPNRHRPLGWHEVESVTQAVDVLVALGYLPPRFSSAYRFGWDASRVWFGADMEEPADAALFRAMFHDPENVRFPALDPAW